MSEYIVKSFDCETGEETEREMTPEEIADFIEFQKQCAENKAAKEAEAASAAKKKAEILDRLGITEDEAKLLLS